MTSHFRLLISGLCLCLIVLHVTSYSQSRSKALESQPGIQLLPSPDVQIADYIVEIFEDSRGTLWFGTMSKGAAYYNGMSLSYLTTEHGLPGNTVVSFAEDADGNLWLGTHSGLSRYDGTSIVNYLMEDGLLHQRVSNLLFDTHGNFWIGTWGGVFRYDGTRFTSFPIPYPDVDDPAYRGTEGWVTEIMEDRHGNIWFGRDGFGACRWDGNNFTHFTTHEGLLSNGVQEIVEDGDGNIWFGSRILEKDNPDPNGTAGNGGLNRYDGRTVAAFGEMAGLEYNEIYTIYKDPSGNIWIGASGVGLFRYDGEAFTLYAETDRMDLTRRFGVQAVLEDTNGVLWLGFSGGLFRLEGSSIINITQAGPWD